MTAPMLLRIIIIRQISHHSPWVINLGEISSTQKAIGEAARKRRISITTGAWARKMEGRKYMLNNFEGATAEGALHR